MPLDPVAHLTRQGWKGKGSGLKADSLSRPIAVKLKTSLGGIGKDREEAFPFWDHVFAAAASSIIIPTPSDSGSSSSSRSTSPEPTSAALNPTITLHRTSTGILSPYAPSGSSTPSSHIPDPLSSRAGGGGSSLNMGIMASAQRAAARRGLYQGFCKGKEIEGTLKEEKKVVVPVPTVVKKRKLVEKEGEEKVASTSKIKVQEVLVLPPVVKGKKEKKMAAVGEESSIPVEGVEAGSKEKKRKRSAESTVDASGEKGGSKAERKAASEARKAERTDRRERKAKRRTKRAEKEARAAV